MWKETCKKPVCTEVWSLNIFVCLKMPQNSLSVSVNAQLHLTADAGDHFVRKLMNSLLGKKKNRCLLYIPWNILHRIWSGVISQSDWSKCVKSPVSWYHLVAIRWRESRSNTKNTEWQRTRSNFVITLRIDIKQARFSETLPHRQTSFNEGFFSCSPVVSLTCDLPHGSAGLCWCGGVCR